MKSHLKLQPLKLPSFKGDLRNYPRFKQEFTKLVAPQMQDDLTCCYVLKSCLNDLLLEIVKNVDDLKDVWNRLDARFGRPSKLVDIVLHELKNIKPIQDEDEPSFVKLVYVIEAAYRDLSMIGAEKEVSNSGCVSIIEEKLPKTTKREWSKFVNNDEDILMSTNKFPELLKFLQKQRQFVEYETSEIRNVEENKDMFHVERTDSRKDSCWIHKSNGHTVSECSVYTGSSPEDRVKLVKDSRACWSCLKGVIS